LIEADQEILIGLLGKPVKNGPQGAWSEFAGASACFHVLCESHGLESSADVRGSKPVTPANKFVS